MYFFKCSLNFSADFLKSIHRCLLRVSTWHRRHLAVLHSDKVKFDFFFGMLFTVTITAILILGTCLVFDIYYLVCFTRLTNEHRTHMCCSHACVLGTCTLSWELFNVHTPRSKILWFHYRQMSTNIKVLWFSSPILLNFQHLICGKITW